MERESIGRIFLRHLAMAIPWGIVFLVIFGIATLTIKQNIKEGIEYTSNTLASKAIRVIYENKMMNKEIYGKTDLRETVKTLLKDPRIREEIEDLLEAIQKER
ncbi:MAG TPA: hypothetical protein ENF54_01590 [Desulfobacteraceae bacterium]|nr:hypothetical protein [Desulfobacteraceae bacterium]